MSYCIPKAISFPRKLSPFLLSPQLMILCPKAASITLPIGHSSPFCANATQHGHHLLLRTPPHSNERKRQKPGCKCTKLTPPLAKQQFKPPRCRERFSHHTTKVTVHLTEMCWMRKRLFLWNHKEFIVKRFRSDFHLGSSSNIAAVYDPGIITLI